MVAFSGCVEQPVSTPQPTTTDISSSPATTRDQPNLPDLTNPQTRTGLNLTACLGSNSSFRLAAALVADDVPPPYATRSDYQAIVDVDLARCEKASVNGVDVGPASFVLVITYIKDPPEPPKGDHYAAAYALEFRTDNEAVAGWLQRERIPISVDHSFAGWLPEPFDFGQMRTTVRNGQTIIYDLQSYPDVDMRSVQEHVRIFYGPSPKLDFWESYHVYTATNFDGEGTFKAAKDSRFAQVTGLEETEAASTPQNTTYRQFMSGGVVP